MTSTNRLWLILSLLFAGTLVYFLAPVLTPFLVAALFAYLGNPLVNRLMRWHLPRTAAVVVVFIFLVLVLGGLIGGLVPLIQDQVSLFIDKLPKIITWLQNSVIPWVQNKLDINIDINVVKSSLMSNWQQAGNVADKVVKTVSHSSMRIVGFVINIVLIPVVTFYLLRDWPKVVHESTRLIPRKIYPTVQALLAECNEVLGAFFRGQLLVMIALGIIYSAGLAIIGLELAVLIGVIIAIFSIVPYLGTIIGLLAALLATLFQFHDVWHVVYVLGLFVVGHVIEGMVLTPLLIGDRIGLHPVAVIFAILAGGQLFGFVGILLALPVAAVIMVWVRFAMSHYLNSRLYHH